LGLSGSNNLGVGVGNMLISKGEGIQGLDAGAFWKTHRKLSRTNFSEPTNKFLRKFGDSEFRRTDGDSSPMSRQKRSLTDSAMRIYIRAQQNSPKSRF
jgi:hypothetical protein